MGITRRPRRACAFSAPRPDHERMLSEGTAGTLRASGNLRKQVARHVTAGPVCRATDRSRMAETACAGRCAAREPGAMHVRRQQHRAAGRGPDRRYVVRRTGRAGWVGRIEAMSAAFVTSPYLVQHPMPFFVVGYHADPSRSRHDLGRARLAAAVKREHAPYLQPALHQPRRAARARYSREERAIDCRLG